MFAGTCPPKHAAKARAACVSLVCDVIDPCEVAVELPEVVTAPGGRDGGVVNNG